MRDVNVISFEDSGIFQRNTGKCQIEEGGGWDRGSLVTKRKTVIIKPKRFKSTFTLLCHT